MKRRCSFNANLLPALDAMAGSLGYYHGEMARRVVIQPKRREEGVLLFAGTQHRAVFIWDPTGYSNGQHSCYLHNGLYSTFQDIREQARFPLCVVLTNGKIRLVRQPLLDYSDRSPVMASDWTMQQVYFERKDKPQKPPAKPMNWRKFIRELDEPKIGDIGKFVYNPRYLSLIKDVGECFGAASSTVNLTIRHVSGCLVAKINPGKTGTLGEAIVVIAGILDESSDGLLPNWLNSEAENKGDDDV